MPTAVADVKEAVKIAGDYIAQLFPSVPNLTLEEVELSDDERHWFVTFGFGLPGFPGALGGREYKTVKIEAQTGKPVAVKIRKP